MLSALVTLLMGFGVESDFEASISFIIVFMASIALALRRPSQKRSIQDRWPSIGLIIFSVPVLFAHAMFLNKTKSLEWPTLLILLLGPLAIILHGAIAFRGKLIRKYATSSRTHAKRPRSR